MAFVPAGRLRQRGRNGPTLPPRRPVTPFGNYSLVTWAPNCRPRPSPPCLPGSARGSVRPKARHPNQSKVPPVCFTHHARASSRPRPPRRCGRPQVGPHSGLSETKTAHCSLSRHYEVCRKPVPCDGLRNDSPSGPHLAVGRKFPQRRAAHRRAIYIAVTKAHPRRPSPPRPALRRLRSALRYAKITSSLSRFLIRAPCGRPQVGLPQH